MVFYTGREILQQLQKNTRRDIITRIIEGRQFDDFATHSLQSNMSDVINIFLKISVLESFAKKSTTEVSRRSWGLFDRQSSKVD